MSGLSERDARIVSAALLRARATAGEIARMAGTRTHSVHYVMNRLLARKILRPFVVINPHMIGLTDYCVFFRTEGATRGTRENIIRTFSTERVGYLAELTGPFQWSFSLFARSVLPVQRLLMRLSTALPGVGIVSAFAIRTEWTLLGKHSLFERRAEQLPIRRRLTGEIQTLDELDQKVINLLSRKPDSSFLALSRELAISEGTFRRRVAQLIEREVILGFAYDFDSTAFGRLPYRAIIRSRYNNETFYHELFKFAVRHRRVKEFVRCLGSWDYELNFEVEAVQQSGDFIQELYDEFGAKIHSAELITGIRTHRMHDHEFVFDDGGG